MATKTFPYTGTFAAWTVPGNITGVIRCKLTGACGGARSVDRPGGAGGYVEGDLTVTAGQNLYLYAGGAGVNWDGTGGTGFNGGGDTSGFAGRGGGATDIRLTSNTLAQRQAVAGGGGGRANTGATGANAGLGGGLTGGVGSGTGNGGGGTQTAGGAAGTAAGENPGQDGALGQGGAGGTRAGGDGGGGGGGGFYGGGGGASATSLGTGQGDGGGGSSFVGGLTGVVVNTQGLSTATGNGSITLVYSLIPNQPPLNYPIGGGNADHTIDQDFRWMWSSDDPDDHQVSFDIRWRVGTGAWNTTSGVTSTVSEELFPAGTFSSVVGSSVEWQVRTYGLAGVASAWSASEFFTPTNPPATSFAYVPALTGIVATAPVIAGSRTDSTPIAQYQIRVVNDVAGTAGTAVLVDTGIVATVGAPTALSVTLPIGAYVNGQSYHVQTKIAYPAGVWQHNWTDSGPLVANIQAPPVPLAVATFDPDDATVTVVITNPVPTDPALATVSNDVFRIDPDGTVTRIATGLPPNGSYTDPWPQGSTAGIELDYRVVAYSATNATAASA